MCGRLRHQPREEGRELDVGDLRVLFLLGRGQGLERRRRPLLAAAALRRRAALLVEVIAPDLPRAPNRARHTARGPVHPRGGRPAEMVLLDALVSVDVPLLGAVVLIATVLLVVAKLVKVILLVAVVLVPMLLLSALVLVEVSLLGAIMLVT